MTMENDKLKKLMDTIQVPEPDEKAREKTLKVAVEEFHRHQKAEEKKVKGFSRLRRLMDKTLRGGPVMRKHLVIAGTAIICIVLGVYFFVGNSTPTWAEVNQSFASYPYHAATVYLRRHAFSETLSFEFWVGQGNRIRVREGNRVTFAKKGAFVKTFDLDTRLESYPGILTLKILKRRGFMEHYDPHPSTPKIDAMFSGRINENVTMVNGGSRISKDIMVFEAESDEGQWGRWKIRILAMRSSKLPIRISAFGEAGMRIDVVYSYFREPPESFFDPEAYEAKLKDPSNSAYSLLYMGIEEPGKKSIPHEGK